MAVLRKKSLALPDEHIDLPGITADVVELADTSVSRSAFEPGMHCLQISAEGRPMCMAHHAGFAISGRLHVEMPDGASLDIGPDDVFDIPAGHDGWVTGDEPFVSVHWAGFRSWVPERSGERVLLTLLFTDIVGSTERAVAIGDTAWREALAAHYRSIRPILDRFRGREVATTGDGLLAAFDGAGRAIEAALAIRDRAADEGLPIRAGVHSGEVEIAGSDVRGVTVHEAARVAAAAAAGEVLLSEATRLLATGAPFEFETRGPFELKGLPGSRTLYAVARATA